MKYDAPTPGGQRSPPSGRVPPPAQPQRISTLRLVHPAALARTYQIETEPRVIGWRADGRGLVIGYSVGARGQMRIAWDPRIGCHVVSGVGRHASVRLDGIEIEEEPHRVPDNAVLRVGGAVLVCEHGAPAPLAPRLQKPMLPGASAATERLRFDLHRCATGSAPVLLVGEPGTGKTLAAQEVHRLSRRPGSLRTIRCDGSSSLHLEAELAPLRAGTSAALRARRSPHRMLRDSHRGTLHFDRIERMPISLQPLLLRLLGDDGEAAQSDAELDIRIIASTSSDLALAVEERGFLSRLHQRLAARELRLTPLRERRADIIGWLEHLWERWHETSGVGRRARPSLELDVEAVELLLLHAWPDNLHGLNRLAARIGEAEVPVVTASHLVGWFPELRPDSDDAECEAAGSMRRPQRRAPTARELRAELDRHGWSVRATAKHYSRDRKQVYRWMKHHGLARQSPTDA